MINSDSQTLFDLLGLAPGLAVLVTNSEGEVKSANPEAMQLFKQGEVMPEGQQLLSLLMLHPSSGIQSFADLISASRSGLSVSLLAPVETGVCMRVVELGDMDGSFAVSLTKTVSCGATEELKLKEETKSDLLLSVAEELSEFGCFSWNMSNDVLEWSDGLLRIFDVERKDFSGKGQAFFNRLHPQDHSEFKQALREASSGDGHFQSTERILRPNGDIRWMQSEGRILSDHNGTPVSLTGICRDITERVENCNELRTQIDDRNALESKLLQTQKLEAIGKLTSGIAHDFNNLLTVINSGCDFLQLMPAEAIREDARELVQSIQGAGERASQLTNQLLLYSRSSTGQPRAVDLNSAMEQGKEFLVRTLPKNIGISLILHPDNPVIHIDPTQLQQVLLNLALNAKDAMSEGGQLSISTDVVMRSPAAGERGYKARSAVLQVVDSGTGISEELLSRMFDPFYTTKPTGAGSGLGLSVVWGIVHAAGGAIEVDSDLGKGTDFRLFLPIHAGSSIGQVDSTGPVSSSGSKSILVVEDEVAVLAIVEGALQHAGFEVTGVTDPVEAIRLAADPAHKIDLLLTDVSMPRLSGPELVQSIRGLRSSNSFPVLFISGNDQHVLESTHGVHAQRHNLLHKPFRIAALIDKVEEVLSSAANSRMSEASEVSEVQDESHC